MLALHHQTFGCSSLKYGILMNVFHSWGQAIRKLYFASDSVQRQGNAQGSGSLIQKLPQDLKLPVLKWPEFQSHAVSMFLPFSLFVKLGQRPDDREAYKASYSAPFLLPLLMRWGKCVHSYYNLPHRLEPTEPALFFSEPIKPVFIWPISYT